MDPASVSASALALLAAGSALEDALPALDSAWASAAYALGADLTGDALAACRPAAGRLCQAGARALEILASGLERSAALYLSTEFDAVPRPRSGS